MPLFRRDREKPGSEPVVPADVVPADVIPVVARRESRSGPVWGFVGLLGITGIAMIVSGFLYLSAQVESDGLDRKSVV